MLKTTILPLAAAFALSAAPAFAAEPANSIKAMFAELNRCLSTVRVTRGTVVTIQFMLNRRGGEIGKPRITYAHWVGDDADRMASAASIARGFDHCLPLPITDALGGAIAGRLIFYNFRGVREQQL